MGDAGYGYELIWMSKYYRDELKPIFGNFTNFKRFIVIAELMWLDVWLSTF